MSTNGQTAAGVTFPDTKLAREATELVRESTTDLVYYHSRRVFWFGSLQGRNRGLSFDPELLYIGAMFHDLGLNAEYRRSAPLPAGPWRARGQRPPGVDRHRPAHHARHPRVHGTRGRAGHRGSR